MKKRTGIVVPISALYTKDCPSCGDFLALKDLADFCEKAGFSIVQLLPVNDTGTQSSPYSGLSAFALHPLFIRINALPEFAAAMKGNKAFATAYKAFEKEFGYKKRFDYDAVLGEKTKLLHLLFNYIEKKNSKDEAEANKLNKELAKFVRSNQWIIPYAVFKNIKDENMQASWKSWDESIQKLSYDQIKLKWQNKAKKSSHDFFVWCQLRASEQFKEGAESLRAKKIILKGDIPILMNEDSVDCWTYPEFFRQELRAGSPPDGGNPMGQNWGFPTYDWDRLEADEFTWWKDRIKTSAQYYDAFRIDHILGFFRIWASKENETTAYLGHTIPYADFTRKTLNELGFDDDRIKWISEPHIPTGTIENITWNHDEATAVLEKVCDRVKTEELWTFKKEIDGDKEIYAMNFFEDEGKNNAVKNALAEKWRDRSLIQIKKDRFIKVYAFENSTAWKTLSGEEQEKLRKLFEEIEVKENKLWEKQATTTLSAIVHASDMIPCAEDLGVNLPVMPEVLKKLDILSLKVIRWTRQWDKPGQPYIPFTDYPELSVATTSVHDSSTLRQWWNQEKDSVWAFINSVECENKPDGNSAFTPEIAEFILRSLASCKSALLINPLQDYLFLEHSFYLENEDDERINIPGSVNTFNWTYRIPVTIEEMSGNKGLLNKIKTIVETHDGQEE
ncbi:MAG: 4-alpha-glucanotransferase [Treponema sp.]|uniref:4-alpha-glucanotransferase n=1 Tax=Treponema sp. TaxID=166 RepID=UPI001D749E47|nr:4-alpha-glucanotransferase [Treponema sp.]MBS7242581.1 4-alpha-glucanotransferase [Treponema sp.]